jgi:hypothetical protein
MNSACVSSRGARAFARQVPVPVLYKGEQIGNGFKDFNAPRLMASVATWRSGLLTDSEPPAERGPAWASLPRARATSAGRSIGQNLRAAVLATAPGIDEGGKRPIWFGGNDAALRAQ